MSKRLIPLMVVAVAAAGVFWWWRDTQAAGHAPLIYSGTMEARQIQAGSRVGGCVTEVLVEEGQMVTPGQPLVRFDVTELAAQHKQAQGRVAEAEARLARLRNGFRREEKQQAEAQLAQQASQLTNLREGPRRQELAQAEAEVRAAEAELSGAEAAFKRVESLAASGDLARQQLDETRTRRNVAQARVSAARERLALLQAGTRAEEIRSQQARVEQASAQAALVRAGTRPEEIAEADARVVQSRAAVAELEARLNEGEVRAPATALAEVVAVRPGDLVPAGRAVVTLLEPAQMWVRVYVPETLVGALRTGQPMEVEAAVTPGKWYAAHVEQIPVQGEFLPRNVQTREDREHIVYGVKVRIDARDHPLKPGMAANARLVQR